MQNRRTAQQCSKGWLRGTNRVPSKLFANQKGATAIETAIISISFIITAAIMASITLSTGMFSASKGDDTISAGFESARGSMNLKGPIIAKGVADQTLSNANTAWGAQSNVVAAIDSADKKEGTASGQLTIDAAKTGLLAYETISPTLDLSSNDSVSLWIKSSIATTSDQLELRISTDTTCSSAAEDVSLPALAAGSWKKVTAGISSSTTRTAIACVGLVADSAYSSSATVLYDDIIARGQATSVVLLIANTNSDDAIDMTDPSDSDDDGLSDSVDRTHSLIVNYTDAYQSKSDLYWTKSFVGIDDDDDLIEDRERAELTIQLAALNQTTPLVKNMEFTIEVTIADRSLLVIQRSTPGKIDASMNLQ